MTAADGQRRGLSGTLPPGAARVHGGRDRVQPAPVQSPEGTSKSIPGGVTVVIPAPKKSLCSYPAANTAKTPQPDTDSQSIDALYFAGYRSAERRRPADRRDRRWTRQAGPLAALRCPVRLSFRPPRTLRPGLLPAGDARGYPPLRGVHGWGVPGSPGCRGWVPSPPWRWFPRDGAALLNPSTGSHRPRHRPREPMGKRGRARN